MLRGRPALEVEYPILDWFSVEAAPMLGVQPMIYDAFHQSGYGISVTAGFWLDDKAFSGFVIRPLFQLNRMHYTTDFEGDPGVDSSTNLYHTEVRLGGMVGRHARWKWFTIAGGLGLTIDVNATNSNQRLRIDEMTSPKVHAFGQRFSPKVDLISRFSLGVVF